MKNLLIVAVCLAVSPFAFAARPFVSIAGIEYAAPGTTCRYDRRCDVWIKNFSKMLETAIVKTNKMAVYEREQLNPVLIEQILGQTGLTNRGGELGGLDGVDYIVSGSITKFGTTKDSSGISGDVLGLLGSGTAGSILSRGIQQDRSTHEMAVDIKIVDVSTGQILVAETVEAAIIASESSNIAGARSGEVQGDSLSDVQREVARKMARLIVTQRFPVRVVKVDGESIVLNYNNFVLSRGECLNLYSLGESIIDPDTNESLGAEELLVGEISVVEATPQLSKAIAIGSFTPKKNMIARKTCSTEEEYTTTNQSDNRRSTWNK